uniref:Ubiquitin-like domain-containing protein n=1 Tax=Globodera rostochiensis TaxID=31243 RepID=A0A914H985_GLORO
MQSFPDHNLECPADWSVLELKKHLSQTCASKPDPTRQRLIYAGRCLDNGQKVRDVLAQRRDGVARGEVAETQVIHMVYIGGKTSDSAGTQNTSAAAGGTAGEGLRHRANNGRPNPSTNNIPAQNQQPTAFMPQQQQQQYFAAFQAVHPQQQQSYDAWMNAYQNYMNQMAQFYHQMPYASAAHFPTGQPAYTFVGGAPGGAAAASAQFVHPAAAAAMAPAHFNAQHQQHQMMVVPQQQHHHEQQAMAENAPAQQRMGAAAFGGAVQADLLDIVYKSVRFALLAMVLYVYSSLERFFLVLAVVAFFWFVHRRRNQQQRDNAAAAAMANIGDGQPQQQQNAGVDDGGDVANGRPGAAPAAAEEAAIVEQRVEAVQTNPPVAVVPQQPSAWNVFFTVVQSFFTSLVPNPMPAPVDIN